MEIKTAENIYFAFRKAQAGIKNHGFRMPKDFVKHMKSRMSEKNREALVLITKYFNTKWRNIDPYTFMVCGFDIFKNFTYTQFFDRKVINLYIDRDKNKKRELGVNKQAIVKSAAFIKKYMKEFDISSLGMYCKIKKDGMLLPIKHYVDNNVDKFLIVYLMKSGYIKLDDDHRAYVPYIVDQYREILLKNDEMIDFLEKIKKSLKGTL